MKVYESYWSDDPQFDSTETQRVLPHLPCPVVTRETMSKLARFAIDVNFGWPREASIVPSYAVGTQMNKWLPAENRWKSTGGLKYVSLQVTGRGGGQWHLVLNQGKLVAAGVGLRSEGGPTCYLTSATFAQLAQGGLSWEESINRGRLVVAGNSVHPTELARAFRRLVSAEEAAATT
jgi:hypothetical protein